MNFRLIFSPALVLLMLLVSCQTKSSKSAMALREKIYSEKVNQELRRAFPTLPATTEMVKQTEEDRNYAATLGPEIIGAVTRHVGSRWPERKWVIKAARPVQGHVLLWIEFPHVDDGADHLIYSVAEGTVVGTFFGGYLG